MEFSFLSMEWPSMLDTFRIDQLVIIGVILALVFVVMMLVIYALILRISFNRKARYIARKRDFWETVLLEYLTGMREKVSRSAMGLKEKDWVIFGEFIEQYLLDLESEEYDRIIRLLWNVGYHEILMNALSSRNMWLKEYAIYYIGLMKYSPASPDLRYLVYDKSPSVSLMAFEALCKIGNRQHLPHIIKNILNKEDINRAKVFDIILEYGSGIIPDMIVLLDDKEVTDSGKQLIVDVLGFHNAIESTETVLKLAHKTDDEELKIRCIKALGIFGDTVSYDFLHDSFLSPNWVVRSQAVKALGSIASDDIIPELCEMLVNDDNSMVKSYCARTLLTFGDKGWRELETLLSLHADSRVSEIINSVLSEDKG